LLSGGDEPPVCVVDAEDFECAGGEGTAGLDDGADGQGGRRRRQMDRLTITELPDRVNLSVSPCHRRLRALERSGAISGYRAQLDAEALGLAFEALIFVTMRGADRDTLDAFEQAVADIPTSYRLETLRGA
jgi:DNA-binding Lrp family transcriptional regulator